MGPDDIAAEELEEALGEVFAAADRAPAGAADVFRGDDRGGLHGLRPARARSRDPRSRTGGPAGRHEHRSRFGLRRHLDLARSRRGSGPHGRSHRHREGRDLPARPARARREPRPRSAPGVPRGGGAHGRAAPRNRRRAPHRRRRADSRVHEVPARDSRKRVRPGDPAPGRAPGRQRRHGGPRGGASRVRDPAGGDGPRRGERPLARPPGAVRGGGDGRFSSTAATTRKAPWCSAGSWPTPVSRPDLVFGAMADKDVPAMADALGPMARRIRLVAAPSPRAAAPEDLLRLFAPRRPDALAAPSLPAALEELLADPETESIIVAGLSLPGRRGARPAPFRPLRMSRLPTA